MSLSKERVRDKEKRCRSQRAVWLAESAKHLTKKKKKKKWRNERGAEELGTDGGGRNKRVHLQPWGARALGKTIRPKLLLFLARNHKSH